MKLATRFLTLLAFAAAVFTGCRPEERDIDLPKIQVGGSDLHFDAETKKASVDLDKDLTTLVLSVAANRAWTADITWDSDEIPWIAVTPDHGEASDTKQKETSHAETYLHYSRRDVPLRKRRLAAGRL